jgi:uncharacterized protein (DUF1778 family)
MDADAVLAALDEPIEPDERLKSVAEAKDAGARTA